MKQRSNPYLLLAYVILIGAMSCELTDVIYGQGRREGGGKKRGENSGFVTDIPVYAGNVILGRPTDNSVTLNIETFSNVKVSVWYGPSGSKLENHTSDVELTAREPREIVLTGLKKNETYEYRVRNAITNEGLFPKESNGRFRTAREAGSTFRFAVQSDAHLDGGIIPDLYEQCLANARAGDPDFLIDLGDTFMTGKHESRESAAKQYAAQRYYLGTIGHIAPVFLVLGNHDGEEMKGRAGADGSSLAVWSSMQRKRLFPNPVPDGFYSGNSVPHPQAGLLQNYYSWTWGDALFVVLDPYWTSQPTRGGRESWSMTIGKPQYDWLATTLRGSKATFKFVFIHQLTGGIGQSGRGGAEAAELYEWGGREASGENTFARHRPGWEKPIHELLVETGVNVVFHGHDHFFARQELDGVVYQLTPQPAHRNFTNHSGTEYGYVKGDFLPSSGHLLVHVAPGAVKIDYVRAATSEMERRGVHNGQVAFTYTIRKR